eukprot:5860508-Pyramimonas_sp.AAC.1
MAYGGVPYRAMRRARGVSHWVGGGMRIFHWGFGWGSLWGHETREGRAKVGCWRRRAAFPLRAF